MDMKPGMLCDVNGLKYVNDTFGHKAGDEYIRSASIMICELYTHSPVFRTGGDEFVVVLHGAHDKKFYESVMDRMRQNVAREVVIGEIRLNVSISAGYARCPEDGTKLEDVVKKADEEMYNNKRMIKAQRGESGSSR